MKLLKRVSQVALALVSLSLHESDAQSLTSLVNLFIGTETGANGGSGGNAFPGAAVPHAMVKVRFETARIAESILAPSFLGWHRR